MALTSVTEGIDFYSVPISNFESKAKLEDRPVSQGINEDQRSAAAGLPSPQPSSSPFVEWTSCPRCGQPRCRSMSQHVAATASRHQREGIKQQVLTLQSLDYQVKKMKHVMYSSLCHMLKIV